MADNTAVPTTEVQALDDNLNPVQAPVNTPSETPESQAPQINAEHATEPKVDVTPQSEDIRAVNKMSKLEKERNEALKKVKETEDRFNTVSNWVLKDPKRYKEALIETSGYTSEQADQVIEEIKKQNPQIWNPEGEVREDVKKKGYVPEDLIQAARNLPEVQYARQLKEQKDKEEEGFYKKFEDDRPDIAENESSRDVRSMIYNNASFYQKSKNLTKEQAFDLAYKVVLHPEKLQEQGEIETLLKMNNASTGNISAPQSGQPSKRGVSLTQQQHDTAQALGLSDEQYAEGMNM